LYGNKQPREAIQKCSVELVGPTAKNQIHSSNCKLQKRESKHMNLSTASVLSMQVPEIAMQNGQGEPEMALTPADRCC